MSDAHAPPRLCCQFSLCSRPSQGEYIVVPKTGLRVRTTPSGQFIAVAPFPDFTRVSCFSAAGSSPIGVLPFEYKVPVFEIRGNWVRLLCHA